MTTGKIRVGGGAEGMDLDDLKALIKSIEHHELQICITGEVFVYQPEEHGEKPDAPEPTEEELDARQKGIEKGRETMEQTLDALQTIENEEIPEAIEILGLKESPEPVEEEENVVIIE